MLQLLLLLRVQFVSVLQEFNELLFRELNIATLNLPSRVLLSLHLDLVLLGFLVSTSIFLPIILHLLLLLHLFLLCFDEQFLLLVDLFV